MANAAIQILIKAKDQASKALNANITSLKDFRGAIAGMGPALGVAAGAAVAAFGVMARASAQYIDSVQKTSVITGTTTEEFSRLAYAAKLSGVESDALKKALKNLGNGAIDAANGTGEAVRGYDALGISVKNADGSMKTNNQLMMEVSGGLSKVADGNTKAAIASMIFGKKVGTELIPMLNLGVDGLKQMGAESDMFGQTIKGGAAAQIEAFNDNMARMKMVFSGIVNTIMQSVAPTLKYFTDWLLAGGTEGNRLAGIMTVIGSAAGAAFKFIVASIIWAVNAFKTLGTAIGDVAFALFQFATGNFKGAFETIKTGFSDAKNSLSETMTSIGDIFAEKSLVAGQTVARNLTEPVIRSMGEINKIEQESKKKEGAIQKAAMKAMEESQKRAEQQKKIEADALAAKIGATNQAYSDIAGIAESGNRDLSNIGKASAIRNAIVDAYSAINKTMASVPFPLNLVASAAIGAKAFANVQAIRGVAHGGLPYVPREGTYLLDQGERVLSPAENEAYNGSGPTMVQFILDGRSLGKGLVDLRRKGIIQVALA